MLRFAFVMAALCALAGCRQERRPVIGFIPGDSNPAVWRALHAGALKAASEFDLAVEWSARIGGNDPARQIADVEAMLDRGVAGIVLAPVDPSSLLGVAERAKKSGIPVIVLGPHGKMSAEATNVRVDNREGGRLAARHLGELLRSEGKIAIIAENAENELTTESREGFAEELTRSFPNIQIVRTEFCMGDVVRARAAAARLLDTYPELRGLFAEGESSGMGSVSVLKERGNTRVRTVVFGANDQLTADLQDRVIDALVVKDQFRMGYESVKAAAMQLRGEPLPTSIQLDVRLVTRMELEKPEVVELLHPDVDKWLSKANMR